MDGKQVKICILIMWSYSVSAQIGYEYIRPHKPLISTGQSRSEGKYYSNTTVTILPDIDYTSVNPALSTHQSLPTDTSSTSSSVTQFHLDNTIQKEEAGIISGRPRIQEFGQSLAPQRLVPGIDDSQYTISGFPQLNDRTDARYHGLPNYSQYPEAVGQPIDSGISPFEEDVEGNLSAIPGIPGVDYPTYSKIPSTPFRCEQQRYPGYYADVDTQCQVFHVCANNRSYNFLCPNGTIFHQAYLVCVWWNTFDCNLASSLYNSNANIYDYSIRQPQQIFDTFPETPDVQGNVLSNTPGLISPKKALIEVSDPSQVQKSTSSILSGKNAKYPDATKYEHRLSEPETYQDNINIYSGIPDTQVSPQQAGGIQVPPSQTKVSLGSSYSSRGPQVFDYDTKNHQFYGYPRELSQDSRSTITGFRGADRTHPGSSLQINDFSQVAVQPSEQQPIKKYLPSIQK